MYRSMMRKVILCLMVLMLVVPSLLVGAKEPDIGSEDLLITTQISTYYVLLDGWNVQVNDQVTYFAWVAGMMIPKFGDVVDAYIFSSNDPKGMVSTWWKIFSTFLPQSLLIDAVSFEKRMKKLEKVKDGKKIANALRKIYKRAQKVDKDELGDLIKKHRDAKSDFKDMMDDLDRLLKIHDSLKEVIGKEQTKVATLMVLSNAFSEKDITFTANQLKIKNNYSLKLVTVNGVKPPGKGKQVVENLTKDIYDYLSGKTPVYYPKYVKALVNVQKKKAKEMLKVSVDEGIATQEITVSGEGLPSRDYGKVYFDSNRNKRWDAGEPYKSVTITSDHKLKNTTLRTGNVPVGHYEVRYEGTIGTGVNFVIKDKKALKLSKAEGIATQEITVTGENFPANEYGKVYFDSNKNKRWDAGEPYKSVTVRSDHKISSIKLRTGNVKTGTYEVRYEGSVSQGKIFSIVERKKISLSVKEGIATQEISVSGSNFPAGEYGKVYFDSNKNGRWDAGEPYKSVTVSSDHKIPSVKLRTGNVIPGEYEVRYEGSVSWGTKFSIKDQKILQLSVTSGIATEEISVSGENFPANEYGKIYFDSNKNMKWDAGEPYRSVSITSDHKINSTKLKTGNVNPGTYEIRYEGSVSVGTPFTVK